MITMTKESFDYDEFDDGDVEIEKARSCMLCVLGRSLAWILINNKAEVPRLSQEGKGW